MLEIVRHLHACRVAGNQVAVPFPLAILHMELEPIGTAERRPVKLQAQIARADLTAAVRAVGVDVEKSGAEAAIIRGVIHHAVISFAQRARRVRRLGRENGRDGGTYRYQNHRLLYGISSLGMDVS